MHSPALVLLLAASLLPSLTLRAEEPLRESTSATAERAPLSPAQIDDLLAPIALYPDALVAIILPAATFPTEVVLAARYLNSRQDTEGIEAQPWDDSVKALARYPEVLKWMDENLTWTQQIGTAFLLQPAAVLTGTQRLRAAAVAAGNLKATPQQNVVVEREVIRIEPAQREVIYVPVYDPIYVYRPRPVEVYYSEPIVTFSSGYHTGLWLSYSCDWNRSTVVYINRPYRATVWHSHPGWSYPSRNYSSYHRDWCPPASQVRSVQRDYERHHDTEIVRPSTNSFVQRDTTRDSSPRDSRGPAASGEHSRNRPETSVSTLPQITPAATVTPSRPAADPSAPATVATNRPDRPRQGSNPTDRASSARPQNPATETRFSGRENRRPTETATTVIPSPVVVVSPPAATVAPRAPDSPRSPYTLRDRNQSPVNPRAGSSPANPRMTSPAPREVVSSTPSSPQFTPATSDSRPSRSSFRDAASRSAPAFVSTPNPASYPVAVTQSAPEQRPARPEKVSLKSAPYYRTASPAAAEEPRREVRNSRDERSSRQWAPVAPAADPAKGTEIASDTERRNQRQR